VPIVEVCLLILRLCCWTLPLNFIWYDIFVNCNWVVTRWQYTFTHKQYI